MNASEETPLERMLRDAWHEAGLRPAFYKRLLESGVYVPIGPRPGQAPNNTIAAGETVDVITFVRTDGIEVIPFYSSPYHLFKASPAGEKTVVFRVRDLFECRPDAHFHLNPYSLYGREFTPPDVHSLLATDGIATTERFWMADAKEAALREPTHVPERILSALRVLFARNFEIRAAYIAERCEPDLDGEELLIVLDLVDGAGQVRAIREAGTVIAELAESGMPRFGVAQLPRDGSAVSRYFLQQAKPFYTISLTGSILSALASRH